MAPNLGFDHIPEIAICLFAGLIADLLLRDEDQFPNLGGIHPVLAFGFRQNRLIVRKLCTSLRRRNGCGQL